MDRNMTEKTRDELKAAGHAYEYDLSDPTEIVRLHRECRDYLQTCQSKHGTDWNGRQFAMNALNKLTADAQLYLIWSNEHQLWWQADSKGYTSNVAEAGRYTRAEAIDIASGSRDGWMYGYAPPEIAIAEYDVLAHKRQPEPNRAARR